MNTLNLDYWNQAILDLADTFQREKDHLCQLDGAIGDGDHGAGMLRGFSEAVNKLEERPPTDVGSLLKTVGSTFVSTVGGVTGIIFGTLFMSAGRAADGKTEVTVADLAAMFTAALEAIRTRGKAAEGDKTMIDALSPAVGSLEDSSAEGLDSTEALALAAKSAERGVETTRDMLAKVGRARYQGDNARGHIDAGAASTALIFRTLATVSSSDDQET